MAAYRLKRIVPGETGYTVFVPEGGTFSRRWYPLPGTQEIIDEHEWFAVHRQIIATLRSSGHAGATIYLIQTIGNRLGDAEFLTI